MRMKILALSFMLACLPVMAFAQNSNLPAAIANEAAKLSPQQRQQYLDYFKRMSVEQQKVLADQAQAAWQKITPEQKEELKNQALQQWSKLSSEEKQSLTSQAQQKWQQMTPEEKQQLSKQFSGLLGGTLTPQK